MANLNYFNFLEVGYTFKRERFIEHIEHAIDSLSLKSFYEKPRMNITEIGDELKVIVEYVEHIQGEYRYDYVFSLKKINESDEYELVDIQELYFQNALLGKFFQIWIPLLVILFLLWMLFFHRFM